MLLFAAGFVALGVAWLAFISIITSAILFVPISLQYRRLKGLLFEADRDGITCTKKGAVVWTLPWFAYGGYRTTRGRGLVPGYTAILDLGGSVVHTLPFFGRPFEYGHPWRFYPHGKFFRRLDQKRPDYVKPPRPVRLIPSIAGIAVKGALALTMLGILEWGVWTLHTAMKHRETLKLYRGWLTQEYVCGATALLMLGGGFLFWAVFELNNRLHPERVYHLSNLPNPEDGPRWEEFLDERGENAEPLVLVPGHRYRHADPEGSLLRTRCMLSVAPALITAKVSLVACMLTVNSDWPNASALFLYYGALAIFYRPLIRILQRSRRLRSFSTFVPVEDRIVVIDQGGKCKTFTLGKPDTHKGPYRPETLVSGKDRILLDRTMLYEVEGDLRHPELMEWLAEVPPVQLQEASTELSH